MAEMECTPARGDLSLPGALGLRLQPPGFLFAIRDLNSFGVGVFHAHPLKSDVVLIFSVCTPALILL